MKKDRKNHVKEFMKKNNIREGEIFEVLDDNKSLGFFIISSDYGYNMFNINGQTNSDKDKDKENEIGVKSNGLFIDLLSGSFEIRKKE